MQRCQKFPMSSTFQSRCGGAEFLACQPRASKAPIEGVPGTPRPEVQKAPSCSVSVFLGGRGHPGTSGDLRQTSSHCANEHCWQHCWQSLKGAVLAVSHLIPIRNACRISCGKCPWVTILYMSRLRVSHGKGKIPITAGLVRWVNHL